MRAALALDSGQARSLNARQSSDGAVAQLGERIVRNDEVRGPIPLSSTIRRIVRSPQLRAFWPLKPRVSGVRRTFDTSSTVQGCPALIDGVHRVSVGKSVGRRSTSPLSYGFVT